MPFKRIFGKKKEKEEEKNKTKLFLKNIKAGLSGAKKVIPGSVESAATAVKDKSKSAAQGLKSGMSSVKKDPIGAAQGVGKAITTSGKSKSKRRGPQTFKKGSSAARRIEKRNKAIHGDKEIDALKARHKAWKEARRKNKK